VNTAMIYGGWVADRPVTGGSFSVVQLVGWVATAGATLVRIGTGGELSFERLRRSTEHVFHASANFEVAEVNRVRTPTENLLRTREVLNPAISDLATTLGVSRQSVYNWLNGDPIADENAAKLFDLAQAADVLAYEGIKINASVLKRKFTKGRTLLQVAQAGESARAAALLLVQIHKRETIQRERVNVRFANRAKMPATADFDLPASNDHV
jgi:transcriptional regulator with XRE-family HTH domain